MTRRIVALITLLVFIVISAGAQPVMQLAQQGPGMAPPQIPAGPAGMGGMPFDKGPSSGPLGKAITENFIPPELVMTNQKAINLTDDQATVIRTEMQKSVSRFMELRWQQTAQEEKVAALLDKQPVDEKAVMAEFNKLVGMEDEIKGQMIAMLIKVKNTLKPDQIAKLKEIQKQSGFGMLPGMKGGKGEHEGLRGRKGMDLPGRGPGGPDRLEGMPPGQAGGAVPHGAPGGPGEAAPPQANQ